jgi:molybdopterin synthase catalytic subunit
VQPPPSEDDWLALTSDELPVAAAYEWAVRPECGAVVLFSGTARDHADGRAGVTELHYEAYDEHVVPRLRAIAVEMRRRWAVVGRIALLHRVGALPVGTSSVIVVVSAPHRPEAFAAARFGIDSLKATAPIWKKEIRGAGESSWAPANDVRQVDEMDGPNDPAVVRQ